MKGRILFATQEPGGARALAPVIRQMTTMGDAEVRTWACGHAAPVFEAEGIAFTDVLPSTAARAVRDVDTVVTATAAVRAGLPLPLDQTLWLAAAARGVPSIAVLDAWQNQRERFRRDEAADFQLFPDCVAVMDDDTRAELIQAGVPEERVVATGQPYLDRYAAAAAASRQAQRGLTVLFVGDPIADIHVPDYHDGYRLTAPGTHSRNTVVVHHLARALPAIDADATVLVRPHPKSPPGEFDDVLASAGTNVRLASGGQPWQAIAAADVVVGMMSMMLVEAFMIGKPVIGVVPQEVEDDQLVLNRRGLIRPVRSTAELEERLREAVAAVRHGAGERPALSDGRATGRVVSLIREMLATKRQERVVDVR